MEGSVGSVDVGQTYALDGLTSSTRRSNGCRKDGGGGRREELCAKNVSRCWSWVEGCALRDAHVVTYHCYRRVELQRSIRLDDELERLQFTIALSLFWQANVRNSERCRDCDGSERKKQSRAGEEKSSCNARLCSDPALGRHLPSRIWQISFSSQPSPFTPKLAQAISFACFAMVESRFFVND